MNKHSLKGIWCLTMFSKR